jgi:predicted TIM-barrel fold metal-dependent hydrolase
MQSKDRQMALSRRRFGALCAAGVGLWAQGCVDPSKYSEADAESLTRHMAAEKLASGQGPYGRHVYQGYRGLAELPWFDLDKRGRLRLVDDRVPETIDLHAHLGMALLFAAPIDMTSRTDRVHHILDCDGTDAGCELDLDVYINANFTPEDLQAMQWDTVQNILWGSATVRTHTLENLADEMADLRVSKAALLPITMGLPFGDNLAERWLDILAKSPERDHFIGGGSVKLDDPDWRPKLEAQAARGARIIKLHPAVQRYFPDDPRAMEIYETCGRLGLVVFLHAGRAGIEPGFTHQYTMMRGYEPMLAENPGTNFILGHAGARDVEDAMVLGRRYPNAWMGLHGQGITILDRIIREVGTERLVFGSDWPFYHVAATLAKVLIVTESRPEVREAILNGNARRLLGL